MGGQQFGAGTVLLDMRRMNRVIGFDADAGVLEVEAGIQWPELIDYLIRVQRGRSRQWGIVQKQTGADRLSIGGALAANAHGRGLRLKPFVGDVESFVLVGADGTPRTCSRAQNAELFRLAIGGYGLFGAVASVRLRLAPRRALERVVQVIDIDDLVPAVERRIADVMKIFSLRGRLKSAGDGLAFVRGLGETLGPFVPPGLLRRFRQGFRPRRSSRPESG
jgi:FAD/FMN-containing dehydrogenase